VSFAQTSDSRTQSAELLACSFGGVSSDDPFVRLPDHIELTPAEAGQLLEVLDIASVVARSDEERLAVRTAVRMITAKLWPELGDLLDGDDEA
jgi:hypothetical protein